MNPPTAADLARWLIPLGVPYALVFARVLGVAATAPGWSAAGLAGRYRLVLAGAVTALVAPLVVVGIAVPGDGLGLVAAFLVEGVVGLALGTSASLVVAGARQAGELVGVQAGLSPASFLDPEAGDGLNPLGHLYGWVALGVFLALRGPVEVVGAVARSYEAIPAGGLGAGLGAHDLVDGLFEAVGQCLALALRAALPPSLALLVAGVGLGLLGRAAPSVSLVTLALPIRTALGLVLAALGLVALVATLEAAWGGAFPFALGLTR